MTSPDMSPEHELASAYVDQQVTAAERARVEASPELRALVESMREIKTLVSAVTPPSAATRDSAVASALAEFDRLAPYRPHSLVPGSSNVVSLDSRRRWPQRVLTAAAAVVLIGVVGVTLSNRSGDDKSSSDATAPTPKIEAATADEAAGEAVPNAGGQVLTSMAPPIVIDDPNELLLLPTPGAEGDTAAPADTTAPAEDGDDTYGATTVAFAQRQAFDDALACMTEDHVFLADIIYKGTPAIAVRDTVTGVTEAIDSTCEVLASVGP